MTQPPPPTLRTGTICYLEIPARDVRRSADFYRAAFAWRIRFGDTDRPSFDDTTGQVSGEFVRKQWHLGQLCRVSEPKHFGPTMPGQSTVPAFRQQMIPAQPFVRPDQPSRNFRERMKRAHFVGHHVLIKVGRTSHRLAGVINDEIQSGAGAN